MSREKVLAKLDKSWTELMESHQGLPDSKLSKPGVNGNWSVKDILAHITTWEEEALKYLPIIVKGGTPPRYIKVGGINAFNAQMAEKKSNFPLSKVFRELKQTHQRLVDYLRSIPEEQFKGETRFRRRLRLDTYSHYPEHTKAILNWRRR